MILDAFRMLKVIISNFEYMVFIDCRMRLTGFVFS